MNRDPLAWIDDELAIVSDHRAVLYLLRGMKRARDSWRMKYLEISLERDNLSVGYEQEMLYGHGCTKARDSWKRLYEVSWKMARDYNINSQHGAKMLTIAERRARRWEAFARRLWHRNEAGYYALQADVASWKARCKSAERVVAMSLECCRTTGPQGQRYEQACDEHRIMYGTEWEHLGGYIGGKMLETCTSALTAERERRESAEAVVDAIWSGTSKPELLAMVQIHRARYGGSK